MDAEPLAQWHGRNERQHQTDRQSQSNPKQHEDAGLQKINSKDHAAVGSERFERGDGLNARLQPRGDRMGNPKTADQQRAQRHQREIELCARHETLQSRRGFVEAANPETCIGEPLLESIGQILRFSGIGECEAIVAIDEASRLQEPGGRQAVEPNQHARAEEGLHAAIRLRLQLRAELVMGCADDDLIADLETKAVEQPAFGNGAPNSVLLCQCLTQIHLRLKPHSPNQRIEFIHGLELDQPALRVVQPPRHGPHLRYFGNTCPG